MVIESLILVLVWFFLLILQEMDQKMFLGGVLFGGFFLVVFFFVFLLFFFILPRVCLKISHKRSTVFGFKYLCEVQRSLIYSFRGQLSLRFYFK